MANSLLPELTHPKDSSTASLPFRRKAWSPSDVADAPRNERRSKTWEIPPTFHCSIIGTCLTTEDMRQVLAKLGHADARTASDHDVHARGVRIAGERGDAAKLLNKRLERKHEAVLKRFAAARNEEAVWALWLKALDQGDISGPYWAVLSHPASTSAVRQKAFGEVHMLSHIVGTSSRLDLARLRRLEQALGEKDAKIARQQQRLQQAALERDRLAQTIAALEGRTRLAPAREQTGPDDVAVLSRRLEEQQARSASLEIRLAEAHNSLDALRREVQERTDVELMLRKELLAAEAQLSSRDAPEPSTSRRLDGETILYVGGLRHTDRLRAIVEERGGLLLFHDGGVEDSDVLLPNAVAQSTAVYFPVDCVSHKAVWRLKKLCKDLGKPFTPLRSAGLSSFLSAVESPAGGGM